MFTIRKYITVVLAVSLMLNLLTLTLLLTYMLFQSPFIDRSSLLLQDARRLAADALRDFDMEALHAPKAFLFHSLLGCVLDTISPQDDSDNLEQPHRMDNGQNLFRSLNISTMRAIVQNLDHEVKVKRSVIKFLSQPIINDHNFKYIHNASDTCAGPDLQVLFVVPSAPEYLERRAKTRYGELYEFVKNAKNRAKLLFFVGKPVNGDGELQSKIDAESAIHRDIVQEDFKDVYRNIRYKAVSMLKWASTFCRHAKFVIRSDDDVRFDIPKALEALEDKSQFYVDFVLGVRKDDYVPEREVTNKWYLSEREYPTPTLPPFALGALLGYPISTVSLLYQAALRVEPIWLDDVFITGLCAPKVGVPVFRHKLFDFIHLS